MFGHSSLDSESDTLAPLGRAPAACWPSGARRRKCGKHGLAFNGQPRLPPTKRQTRRIYSADESTDGAFYLPPSLPLIHFRSRSYLSYILCFAQSLWIAWRISE